MRIWIDERVREWSGSRALQQVLIFSRFLLLLYILYWYSSSVLLLILDPCQTLRCFEMILSFKHNHGIVDVHIHLFAFLNQRRKRGMAAIHQHTVELIIPMSNLGKLSPKSNCIFLMFGSSTVKGVQVRLTRLPPARRL